MMSMMYGLKVFLDAMGQDQDGAGQDAYRGYERSDILVDKR
jgi:hypothetical protein